VNDEQERPEQHSQRARLNIIAHLLSKIPYEATKPEWIKLPKATQRCHDIEIARVHSDGFHCAERFLCSRSIAVTSSAC
jgi:hypothetical protein